MAVHFATNGGNLSSLTDACLIQLRLIAKDAHEK